MQNNYHAVTKQISRKIERRAEIVDLRSLRAIRSFAALHHLLVLVGNARVLLLLGKVATLATAVLAPLWRRRRGNLALFLELFASALAIRLAHEDIKAAVGKPAQDRLGQQWRNALQGVRGVLRCAKCAKVCSSVRRCGR